MKILLLTQFLSQTRGGGEYVFDMIAEGLAKNNHDVWIITNKIKGEQYNMSGHDHIHLVFVPPTLEHGGGLPSSMLDNVRYTVNAVIAGRKIVRKMGIDIIHSNNFAPALAGSVLSYITKIPHITTIHDVFSFCGKCYWRRWREQNGVSRISVLLAPLLERVIARRGHRCIHTVSDASKDDLIRLGAKKPIYVIHNAIRDNNNDNYDGSGNRVDKPSDTNPLEFVFVGRLVFYKNLEVIIRAINILKRAEPRVRLVIIGDGPHKNTLQKLVKEMNLSTEVNFAGYVSHDKKMQMISRSVALLFPSLCEGFGLVILEAFSKGRPVLASNIRPMSDIIQSGETGFVLDPHDEKQWVKQMLFCVQNPQETDRVGRTGKILLHKSFSSKTMLEKVLCMYDEQSK